MLYGSQQNCTEMLPCDRSHQLGKGQSYSAVMPRRSRPSRLVYGSQKINAETLCEKRSHQLWEPRKVRRNVKDKSLLPVREGSSMRRSNANVPSPFPISFTEAKHQLQKCYLKIASQGKGQLKRAINNAKASLPFPTSLWANPCTQKCHGVDAHQFMGGSEETHSNVTGIALSHQLGKDIICTLIKPLLFLPFLLIYGSQRISAEMPRVIRSQGEGHHGLAAMAQQPHPSHQFWATSKPQKCHAYRAQYNQRPQS